MPRSMLSRPVCGALLLLSTVLGASGCGNHSSGEGSCVAPEATSSVTTGAPAETVRVSGRYWGPCNDTPNDSIEEPWSEVSVEWMQADAVLSQVDMSLRGGRFSGEVPVPPNALPGEAMLVVSVKYQEVEIPFTVTPR